MKPFLLLQARRPLDPMRDHEHDCFARALGVPREQIRTINVVDRTPGAADVDACRAVLVGGAGHFSALGDDPWLMRTAAFLLDDVVGSGKPMFAVCFGIQLLGRAMGVEVVHDPDNCEVGTYEVELLDAARQDPLFAPIPRTFLAQQGHNDRLAELPPGTIGLATNANTPVQALRLEGKPVWATQFHPELTRLDNATRYKRYIQAYSRSGTPAAADPVLATLRDTPHPADVLRRFGRLVLDGEL